MKAKNSRYHGSRQPRRTALSASQLATNPKGSQIGESQCQDHRAYWQTDEPVCQGKINRMMRRGFVYQHAENRKKRCGEEGREPYREAHQKTGKPSQIAQWDTKQI